MRVPVLRLRSLKLAAASGVALSELVVYETQQSLEQNIANGLLSAPGG